MSGLLYYPSTIKCFNPGSVSTPFIVGASSAQRRWSATGKFLNGKINRAKVKFQIRQNPRTTQEQESIYLESDDTMLIWGSSNPRW
jgi:hypothetical protein